MIPVVGLDMTLRNTGVALGQFDAFANSLKITDIRLVETEKQSKKGVRVSSDDLRCTRELSEEVNALINNHGAAVVFAEIPGGSKSHAAAKSFGITLGVLGSLRLPLIEVQPTEVKEHFTGTKTASKDLMVSLMVDLYPDLPWLRRTVKGEEVLLNKNEHLADAVAIAHTGVLTKQFRDLISLLVAVS